MGVFQGHQVLALAYDILIPILVLVAIVSLISLFRINKTTFRWIALAILLFLVVFWWPNSVYAVLEIKHLLLIDTVADNPDVMSFIVFGGISLFGYLLTIIGNRWIIQSLSHNDRLGLLLNIMLSTTGGFGGVAGLVNITSFQGSMSPGILIMFLKWILLNPGLLWLAVGLATLIFLSVQLTSRPS